MGPGYEICDRDISATYEKRDVWREIVERFNMTLRLDPHYPVIAYGLIIEKIGLREFNLPEAAQVGRQFWPEEFGDNMSNSKLRAILDEMAGLGVLGYRHNPSTGEDLYRLASTNVLRLLGSESAMRKELQDIRHERHLHNPMQYHRLLPERKTKETAGRARTGRSPFTVGDELQIAGFRSAVVPTARQDANRLFTVSLVFGTKASGIEEVRRALESLHNIESDGQPPYRLRAVPAVKAHSLRELRHWTDGLGARSAEASLLHIEMPWLPDDPGLHGEILEHVHTLRPGSARGTLRAVLTFGPQATWQWLSAPDSSALEASLINVHLAPWTGSALRVLLSEFRLMDSPRQIEYLQRQTGGWFTFLQSFMRAAPGAPGTDDPEKVLGLDRDALAALDSVGAQRMLAQYGVSDIPHVQSIFTDIISSDIQAGFERDLLKMVLAENSAYDSVPADVLLSWGMRLGIIGRVEAKTDIELFRLDPTVVSLFELARKS
jgi:hypothetical protein